MSSDTETCIACDEDIESVDDLVKCKECNYPYHLKGCSGISEPFGKTRGASLRKTFTCPTCKARASRSGSQSTTTVQQTFDVATAFAELSRKLDSLMPLKEKVDNIERSVQTMSDHFDEIMKRLDNQDKELAQHRKRIEKLENAQPTEELHQLNADLNELEMRNRKKNLEIHGVSVTADEDLINEVNKVGKLINQVEVKSTDIEACHRLPAKSGKIPGIIVRFEKQTVRDQWLQKKQELKEKGKGIYLCENMTRRNRSLLYAVKDWAKINNYRFVWHSNGKILIRRKEGDSAYVIKNEADLEDLPS